MAITKFEVFLSLVYVQIEIFLFAVAITKGTNVKYDSEANIGIQVNLATIFNANSKVTCATKCLNTHECCKASYIASNKQCMMDLTDGCRAVIQNNMASSLLTKACPSGWHKFDRRCIFIGGRETKENAKRTCATIGGRLVIIDSVEKNAWIHGVLQYFGISSHIAGVRVGVEWYWEYEDGSVKPFNYENWRSGEPNGPAGLHDCAMILLDDGGWNDIECTATPNLLCEQI